MVMIQCPECGKNISDTFVSCPDCGSPFSNTKIQHKKRVPGRGFGITSMIMGILGAFFVVIAIILTPLIFDIIFTAPYDTATAFFVFFILITFAGVVSISISFAVSALFFWQNFSLQRVQ